MVVHIALSPRFWMDKMYDTFFILFFQMSGLTKNPLASLAALGLAGMAPSNTGGLNPTGGFCVLFDSAYFFRYFCILLCGYFAYLLMVLLDNDNG